MFHSKVQLDKCQKEIKNFRFDHYALEVCSKLNFSHSFYKCLKIIQNKNFSDEEIQKCNKVSLDLAKRRCLKKNGKTMADKLSLSQRKAIQEAISAIDGKNYTSAINKLKNLL